MILKRLLQINLFVSIILAITFILTPVSTLAIYGLSGDESLYTITRYFGTTHVAFAVLLWLALRANDPRFLRLIAASFFAGDLTGTIVLLIAQLHGTMNNMGWAMVGLSCFFAVGYGYSYLREA